jgi:hypothetical protein
MIILIAGIILLFESNLYIFNLFLCEICFLVVFIFLTIKKKMYEKQNVIWYLNLKIQSVSWLGSHIYSARGLWIYLIKRRRTLYVVDERFDRAMASNDWLAFFLEAELTNVLASHSDHSPISYGGEEKNNHFWLHSKIKSGRKSTLEGEGLYKKRAHQLLLLGVYIW